MTSIDYTGGVSHHIKAKFIHELKKESSVKLFMERTVGNNGFNPKELFNLIQANRKNCLKHLLPALSDSNVSDISDEEKC